MSNVKWSASGALHIGLGKSFLGSLTWSDQASKDLVTVEVIFSSAMWDASECSISHYSRLKGQ